MEISHFTSSTAAEMNIVIFLGAGASAADGVPLQEGLFREYFSSVGKSAPNNEEDRDELPIYFKNIFGIDVNDKSLIEQKFDRVHFPTFEEALGIIDLAMIRGESLKGFSISNREQDLYQLGSIRKDLIFLMIQTIDRARKERCNKVHKTLIKNIKKMPVSLTQVAFVSTNYDFIIDDVLFPEYHKKPKISVDYGVDLLNYDPKYTRKKNHFKRPGKNRVQLHKIHGSLNWLHCTTCNTIELTPNPNNLFKFPKRYKSTCADCRKPTQPMIVPPTYYKDMSNVDLQIVWRNAEKSVRMASHIVFCGYSFPEADMHVKYLFKRSLTNRKTGPPQIIVVNHHEGKNCRVAEEEERRYKRILGENVVFLKKSFQDFAENPKGVLDEARKTVGGQRLKRRILAR